MKLCARRATSSGVVTRRELMLVFAGGAVAAATRGFPISRRPARDPYVMWRGVRVQLAPHSFSDGVWRPTVPLSADPETLVAEIVNPSRERAAVLISYSTEPPHYYGGFEVYRGVGDVVDPGERVLRETARQDPRWSSETTVRRERLWASRRPLFCGAESFGAGSAGRKGSM